MTGQSFLCKSFPYTFKCREPATYNVVLVGDKNNDASVNFDEFRAMVEDYVGKVFKYLDSDEDGFLNEDVSVKSLSAKLVLEALNELYLFTDFNTIVEEDGTAGVDMIDSEDDVHTAEQSRHCTLQMRQPRLRNPQMRASGGLILLMILAGVVLLFFLLSPDIEEIFSKYNCGATNIPLFLFQFIPTQDNINSYSAG